MRCRNPFVWPLLMLVLAPSPAVIAAEPSFRIYFTAAAKGDQPGRTPAESFDCNDKIYAVVEMRDVARTRHTMLVLWNDPRGKQRQRTENEFQATQDPETVWFWLKLHPPADAALERLLDPSTGMREFSGTWTVRFHLDGRFLQEKKFAVSC